jgi:hypothetical protein
MNDYSCKGYGMLLKICKMKHQCPKQHPADKYTGEPHDSPLMNTPGNLDLLVYSIWLQHQNCFTKKKY